MSRRLLALGVKTFVILLAGSALLLTLENSSAGKPGATGKETGINIPAYEPPEKAEYEFSVWIVADFRGVFNETRSILIKGKVRVESAAEKDSEQRSFVVSTSIAQASINRNGQVITAEELREAGKPEDYGSYINDVRLLCILDSEGNLTYTEETGSPIVYADGLLMALTYAVPKKGVAPGEKWESKLVTSRSGRENTLTGRRFQRMYGLFAGLEDKPADVAIPTTGKMAKLLCFNADAESSISVCQYVNPLDGSVISASVRSVQAQKAYDVAEATIWMLCRVKKVAGSRDL